QVRDRSLAKLYRGLYPSSKGTFPLSVPFMEKFFALAKRGVEAGWVGKITSNAFSQREFGVRIVETFLPKLDLVSVINSEDEWIAIREMPRAALAKHPWSLVGSGAVALIDSLGNGLRNLGDMAARVGFYGDSHADELFFMSERFAKRQGYPPAMIHPAVRGAS